MGAVAWRRPSPIHGWSRGVQRRAARHHQALSRGRRQRRGDGPTRGGRHPRHHRRERRRQVHADEHPLRAPSAGRRSHHRARGARHDPRPEHGHRVAPGHGPPALHARAQPDRRRERHPRPCAHEARPDRHPRRGGEPGRAVRALRDGGRAGSPCARPVGRRPPAGGDPQGPVPGRRRAHPRRAHGRADAAGVVRAVRHAACPCRPGQDDRVHLPQAQGSARGLPARDRDAGRQGHRRARDGRHRPSGSSPA